MTEPRPLATGGMSRAGTTTIVKISSPRVPLTDRLVLCPAICKCKEFPDKSVDGKSLKQACVSRALMLADKEAHYKSVYKPEINYDMTKHPPAPIMDSTSETKGHGWLPAWIKKWWDTPDEQGVQRPTFKRGKRMIRRPDLVIVNDPSKPPTQDNIKQVVEIKFPPDHWSRDQKDDYAVIAGGEDKLAKLEPDDCSCDRRDPEAPKVPSPDAKTVAAGAMALMVLLGLLAF